MFFDSLRGLKERSLASLPCGHHLESLDGPVALALRDVVRIMVLGCMDPAFDVNSLLRFCERAIEAACLISALVFLPLMILVRVWEISARNALGKTSAWYSYAEGEALVLLVLLSLAYAYSQDAHVRVDIVRERLSPRARALIEVLGTLLFVLPFTAVVVFYGIQWVEGVAEVGQRSALALGRPLAWVIRAALPVGFALLALAALVALMRNVSVLVTGAGEAAPQASPPATTDRGA